MSEKITARERIETQILHAARTEFITHGYKGSTLQAIADRSGLAKTNVLYYFKSKEILYHHVLKQTLDMWDKGIGDICYEDGPKVAIEKFIHAKVKMAFEQPQASKIYALEIIQGAPLLKEYARTYLRQWVREKSKIFERWIDNGDIDPIDPEKLIFLIWSSTQHYADFDTQVLTVMNRADFEQNDIELTKQFLTQFILRGCGLE